MTIADALRRVAPPAAAETDDEVRVRDAALEIVYAELHRLARSRIGDRAEAEDIASSLAYQIAATGPRDPDRSPPTDGQARAYLWTAIRNRMVDRHRVAHQHAVCRTQ